MKIDKKIDWIFFDVGGVLTNDRKAERWRIGALTSVIKKYNPRVNRQQVEVMHQQASQKLGSINRSIFEFFIDDKKQARTAEKELYLLRDQKMDYVSTSTIRPNALAVIKQLATKYKLGLIANQPKEMKQKFKNAHLEQYFTHFGVSKEYGLSKPDKKLFLTILQETKANPVRSALVDDNPERGLAPAKKLGFTTVWYRHNYWGDRTFSTSSIDYQITNLNQLLGIF